VRIHDAVPLGTLENFLAVETAPVVASRRPLWDLKHPDDPDGPHE